MSAIDQVSLVWGSVDLRYPRFLASHPRNAGVDFMALGDYAKHGRTERSAEFAMYIKTRRPLDTINIPGLALTVSDRLRRTLMPLTRDDVEFVPVTVNDERYWILRVVTVIDAVDLELSETRQTEWGVQIERPVWVASRLSDPRMFRIPQDPTAIWATPAVADAVQESGCTDMNFFPRGEVVP